MQILICFFNERNDLINFIEGYSSIILEAKRKAAAELTEQGRTGINKILTLKQMLQRLPIALAQVIAGNNSESILLWSDKGITKQVYNNIIRSKKYKNGYYIYELKK